MTTIIAECCQNHNGDKSILKDMIWAAAESGADIVKMQSIDSSTLSHRPEFDEGVVENGVTKVIKRPYNAELARLSPMDLTIDDHYWFIEECQKAKVKPMTTIFAHNQLEFISKMGWDSIKIASYDCGSFPMIDSLKDKFKHIYISTGASFDEEIQKTASILKGHSFSFLHCVTIYPTPLDQMHLRRIGWLKQFTPSVGFSDHSLVAKDGLKACLGALHFGVDVIERHFTVLKPDESRDGPVSINPSQLKELVNLANLSQEELADRVKISLPEYDQMLGQETRQLSPAELLNRDYYRGRFASKINGKTIYNWEELNF